MNKRIRKKKRKALSKEFKRELVQAITWQMNRPLVADYFLEMAIHDQTKLEALMLPRVENA